MAGVRISGIPKNAEEKLIKIHFSKPQNGGGVIKKIYYPLFNNEAVVIYHDPAGKFSILMYGTPFHSKFMTWIFPSLILDVSIFAKNVSPNSKENGKQCRS